MTEGRDSGQFGSITKSFDQYEYIAVAIPGATLLFGLWIVFAEQIPLELDKDFSLGALGLFIIASLLSGQLLRTVGELVENAVWRFAGGMPTEWILDKRHILLDELQLRQLKAQLGRLFGYNVEFHHYYRRREEWQAVTQRIYAKLNQAQRTTRIDAFNRTSGLMIGSTVALTVTAISALIAGLATGHWWPKEVLMSSLALGLAALTLYRFLTFGKLEARELFVEFLELLL